MTTANTCRTCVLRRDGLALRVLELLDAESDNGAARPEAVLREARREADATAEEKTLVSPVLGMPVELPRPLADLVGHVGGDPPLDQLLISDQSQPMKWPAWTGVGERTYEQPHGTVVQRSNTV